MRTQVVSRAAALCLVLIPAAVFAQPPAEPVVVVHGEGRVTAAPDMARVIVGGEHRARDARQAQADHAAAMTAVHTRLAALVPKDAVRTLSYDLQLEFDYRDGRQVPRGYVARTRVEVRVDDVTAVGALLEAAIATGATSVHGVHFDLKAREQLEREALTRAVADARARAEAAASGAGRALGSIVRIEETGAGGLPRPEPMLMSRTSMESGSGAPAIEAGEIEIRASVTLTATIR